MGGCAGLLVHLYGSYFHYSQQLDQLILSPLPSPPSRLVFSSAHKCKMWQERLLESLRRSVRTLKSTFAFVHRAYSRDQKMEGSQQCGPDPGTALHSLKGEGNSIKQFLPLPYTSCWCEVYILLSDMGNSLYCNKPRTTDVASPLWWY